MKAAVETLSYIGLVAYTALAVATINAWRVRRDRATAWAAVCFGALGVVVVLARVIPDHPHGFGEQFAQKLDLVVFLLFPYLLHRFTTVFRTATSRLERALGLMTLAIVVWTFSLPRIPASGEPRPGWFWAYLVGFLVHWTVLSSVSSIRLWRAGGGQPSVARRRMRLLAFATATLTLALFAVVATSATDSVLALVSQALSLVAAGAFFLGLMPPPLVRLLWRRPEQERVQDAIKGLITLATTREEVAERVLGPMAAIVGAQAVALYDDDRDLIGSHGFVEGESARADAPIYEFAIPGGTLMVRASPYSPFFGNEELRLVQTLGAMTGIALDRVRLFQHEREARLALERADEVKTNFIALASHELRTPVTTIHGLATTLNRVGAQLSEEQRAELRSALERQSERMAQLVEQLLDLSRLDAQAIEIRPERFNVRERLEEIVAASAADRVDDVEIDAPGDLEASADPAALERIVSNLVTNALRYGTPPVIVDASQTDRHLRVAVEDRGEGVPTQFVPDLFERFTRVLGERTSGTGLGLAIARSYARAHDGDLVYESAEPHGARFQLVLPTKPSSDASDAESPEVEAHRSRFLWRFRR